MIKNYHIRRADQIDDPETRDLVQDFMNSVDINDYKSVKNYIFPKAVKINGNQDILAKRPYIEFLDFAVVFEILISHKGEDTVTISVSNSLAETWNVLSPVIFEDAIHNNMRDLPPVVTTINDMLGLAPEEDNPINTFYVMTNSTRYYGATTMFYKGELERAYKCIGPFSVIPSSVHEVLLVPDTLKIPSEELKGMLIDVNSSIVKDEDILGDHIYRFDPDNGLRIAE